MYYLQKQSFPRLTNNGNLKKGNYAFHHEQIKSTFPNSNFLAIIRHNRAVFSSQKNSIYSRTGVPFQTNPYRAAKARVK
jgi:hypothetical protein